MTPPTALVIRSQSRAFTIRTGVEERVAQVPKRLRYEEPGTVDPVAVGDRVEFTLEGGDVVINTVLPRTNLLSRPASGRQGKRQLLAANLDFAVIVLAARDPEWKTSTVDRYLVMASTAKVAPVICINKIDLDPTVSTDPSLEVYRDLEIPVIWTSAQDEVGVDGLQNILADKTAVLIGPSGTGKSSLLNRLVPDADVRVGEISDRTSKGRHTTTWVEMLDLPGGGHLVDSPGIRVLDLSELEAHELSPHFPELRARAGECQFRDCHHLAEPKCGVKAAVERGNIATHRYESYKRIYDSLEKGQG